MADTPIEVPVGSLSLEGFVPTPVGHDVSIEVPVGALALTGLVPTHDIAVEVPLAGAGVVIDEYDFSNRNTLLNYFTTTFAFGQSFTGDGKNIAEASVMLSKSGDAFGDITAEIYAHTGTFGTSSKPTGPPLATSDPVSATTLTGIMTITAFTFPTPFPTVAGTHYVVAIRHEDSEIGALIFIGSDTSSPTHAGNASINTGAWQVRNTEDLPFELKSVDLNLKLEGFAPTVDTGAIPPGILTLTGFAPTLDIAVEVPTGSVALTGFAPTPVGQDVAIEVPLGVLTLTGFIPVVTQQSANIEVEVPAGTLVLTGLAPVALQEGDVAIDPGLGVLTLTGFAPNLILTLFNVETCDMDVIFPKNVESLVIPTLQDIEFNLDRLKKLNLPDPVNVEIEPFIAFEPVAPTKEVERIQFLYADFANTVQTIIDGKIGELTSEVKPYDVEYVEWGRNKEDLLDATEEAIETSFDGEGARGFVAPSGVFNKDLSKQSIRNKRTVSRANEQFFSEQNKSTLQNISTGLEAGNTAENIVRTTDQQRQTINLQAVQNLAEIDFRVFEVYLQRHNSRIEVKRIKHQAWIEELKGKLLILQERELAIKGHTLNLVERTQQVEMFNASIDYLNVQQALKEINLENFVLEAEQEKNKLLKFQAEVDIFSSLINLNISKFNLYKAGIEFEESKVDQFQQEAAVAEAQLRVQSAKTNSSRVASDTKIDIARAKLGAQVEKLRAARTRLETVLTEGRVKAVGFSSDLLVYRSDLRDWLNDVSNDVLELTAQAEDGKIRDVTFVRDETRILNEVVRSDTEAQNIKTLADLNAEVISESADITAKTEITSKLVHTLAGG